jgi:hypothetical protein
MFDGFNDSTRGSCEGFRAIMNLKTCAGRDFLDSTIVRRDNDPVEDPRFFRGINRILNERFAIERYQVLSGYRN